MQYYDGSRVAFKSNKTSLGTFPEGSQWMKNPIPPCTKPEGGYEEDQVCPNGTQFPPPLPGLLGFGTHGNGKGFNKTMVYDFEWSIVDLVWIPVSLPRGEYVFSQRWDSEQTSQVWTSCANVHIV